MGQYNGLARTAELGKLRRVGQSGYLETQHL